MTSSTYCIKWENQQAKPQKRKSYKWLKKQIVLEGYFVLIVSDSIAELKYQKKLFMRKFPDGKVGKDLFIHEMILVKGGNLIIRCYNIVRGSSVLGKTISSL